MGVTITEGTQTIIKSTTDGADEIQHVRNDGGTVGVVSAITTGSIANIAVLHAGTIAGLPDPLGSVVVTTGTFVAGDTEGGTLDLVTRIGNIGTIESGTMTTTLALNSGTITTIAAGTQNTLGTVGVVNNIVTGTIAAVTSVTDVANLAKGTLTTGSIANVAMLHAGTAVVSALPDLPGGTVDEVTLLKAGTVKLNATPAGSTILTTHVLGTGGGTFVGTILAPAGAGTSVYVTGLSIIGRSGTVDCGIADNVAGTTGAGVLARGFFDPGGGIARDFNPTINLGANGTIAYFLVTAGTVDLTVTYWVSP